jgi:ketosteroid isomerase-like protein
LLPKLTAMPQQNDPVIDQVMVHEGKLLEAFSNCDEESLDELLHDELLFVIPTGQVITKSEDMEAIRSGKLVADSVVASDRKVNVIGDTAIVSLQMEMKGRYAGQPFEGRFRYIRVWKQFGSAWKVIAGSGMQLP